MTTFAARIDDLTIADTAGQTILDGVSFEVTSGEIHAVVGESGSGKTTTALAMLGHVAAGLRVISGRALVGDVDLLAASERKRRAVRGAEITYVPQEATTALNPRARVAPTLERMRAQHHQRSAPEIDDLLTLVDLPLNADFKRRYPHQLSGGQQQRLAIAAALAPHPAVVVFDEPTTGLDAIVQTQVLERITTLRDEVGFAAVFVTHDLHAAELIADRITVMLDGRVVEDGPSDGMWADPRHPYTRALLDAMPTTTAGAPLTGSAPLRPAYPAAHPRGCPFHRRCPIAQDRCATEPVELVEVAAGRRSACVRSAEVPAAAVASAERSRPDPDASPVLDVVDLRASYGHGRHASEVLHGVDVSIARGERVALVGESGSGKSTLSRSIVGLHPDWSGTVNLDGVPLARSVRGRPRRELARIQMVFQNPASSLNPRRRVLDAVAMSGRQLRGLSAADARAAAVDLLLAVELDPSLHSRRPGSLSGGQRQRVAIAQCLMAEPDLLICDEVTSALDVSVQAGVIELLRRVSDELGLALLFVTHDLGVVASIAHRTVVLQDGSVVEANDTAELFASPEHGYTQQLVYAGRPPSA